MYMTFEEAENAVKANGGMALQFVAFDAMTEDLCREAVEDDGLALQWVPDELKTESVCLAALRSSPRALELVPEKLLTQDVCMQAVLDAEPSSEDVLDVFEAVPERFRSPGLCLEAVARDPLGRAMELVPAGVADAGFCARACAEGLRRIPGSGEEAEDERIRWLNAFWDRIPKKEAQETARLLHADESIPAYSLRQIEWLSGVAPDASGANEGVSLKEIAYAMNHADAAVEAAQCLWSEVDRRIMDGEFSSMAGRFSTEEMRRRLRDPEMLKACLDGYARALDVMDSRGESLSFGEEWMPQFVGVCISDSLTLHANWKDRIDAALAEDSGPSPR